MKPPVIDESEDEEVNAGKIVETLQNPVAVVTYRAIVGLFAAVTVSLVAMFGNSILQGIKELQATMIQVQLSVAQASGRLDGQESRIGRVETSVDSLAKEQGSLDRRVTVIEARQK